MNGFKLIRFQANLIFHDTLRTYMFLQTPGNNVQQISEIQLHTNSNVLAPALPVHFSFLTCCGACYSSVGLSVEQAHSLPPPSSDPHEPYIKDASFHTTLTLEVGDFFFIISYKSLGYQHLEK